MGALKCRRRAITPPSWWECILVSLGDGNLFIFAIGTAGGVLAVGLMEFYRGAGELHHYRGMGVFLILASFLIIFFAPATAFFAGFTAAFLAAGFADAFTFLIVFTLDFAAFFVVFAIITP